MTWLPDKGMSAAQYYTALAQSHPHRVHVKNYLSRCRAGELPRRDKIWDGNATSIVRYVNRGMDSMGRWKTPDGRIDNTTTFCFTTENELERFKKEYSFD